MSSKIDGVPRELLVRILKWLHSDEPDGWASELRALLAAPVVEHQPVLWVDAAYLRDHSNKSIPAFRKPTQYEPLALYTSPPELAQLHDAIARLKGGQGEPVSVVLPERRRAHDNGQIAGFRTYEEAKGWNDCLDKVKEMNNG